MEEGLPISYLGEEECFHESSDFFLRDYNTFVVERFLWWVLDFNFCTKSDFGPSILSSEF